jgi:hypothetical protein
MEHSMLQGSVLGHFIYICEKMLKGAKLVLFADDTNLLIATKD